MFSESYILVNDNKIFRITEYSLLQYQVEKYNRSTGDFDYHDDIDDNGLNRMKEVSETYKKV